MSKKKPSGAPSAASAPRASATAVVTLGLFAFQVKLFAVAPSSRSFSLTQVHAKCGKKMLQQYFCETDNEIVPREAIARGLEHEGQFVVFSEDERRRLESPRTDQLDLVEFVPAEAVDAVHFDKSYYLGADAGDQGEAGYKLLVTALGRSGTVAVGRYFTRGRDQAVAVRPYRGGLVLHYLHHADEFRSFEVSLSEGEAPEMELELALHAIEERRGEALHLEKYRDGYPHRLRAAAAAKLRGADVEEPEQLEAPKIVSLVDALRRTVGTRTGPALKKREEPASVRSIPVKAVQLEDDDRPSQRMRKT